MVTQEPTTEAPQSASAKAEKSGNILETLFKAGAHYGYTKSKRHPSARQFLFGAKNRVELFDLEKTISKLEEAKAFAAQLGREGKMILFVSSKAEARDAIEKAANSIGQPFVAGRFKGGTLSNFDEIRKRVKKLEELTGQREIGELSKYTKKERLMIDREIEDLEKNYSGLTPMTRLPDALYIVDIKRESIALKEARALGIPVISLSNSDCNLTLVDQAIPANDSSKETIQFVTNEIANAFKAARS